MTVTDEAAVAVRGPAYLATLAGRRVAVVGLARSGVSVARFIIDAGASVTIYDGRPANELTAAIGAVTAHQVEGRPVSFALGPDVDPSSTWRDAILVVTSGIAMLRYRQTLD